MRLSEIEAGSKVRMQSLKCCKRMKDHLNAIGMHKGSEIEVIKNGGHCPMLIKVKDAKHIIGRGQARKIIVENG